MAEYKSAIETLISGTSGKDTVTLTGISYSTVQGGAGNDTIYARWGSNYNRYEGEAGNDIIIANYDAVKSGESSSLGGGNANTISGGAGNDTIYLGGYDNTHGGKIIRSYSSVIEYSNDDGNDVIIDTLGGGYSDYKIKLTAGLLSSTEVSGSNIILKVAPSAASTSTATGAITLLGAKGSTVSLTGTGEVSITRNADVKSKVTVQSGDDAYMSNGSTLIGGGADVTVTNRGERVSIGGTYGQVENYGSKVTITGGKTAVSIDNRGTNSVIKGSTVAGGDYIFNYNDGNKINGDKGDDFIVNYQGNKTSITGGAGNDAISILGGQAVTVNGDAGKDYIYNEVKGAVILGGKDDDEISLKSGSSAVIKYAKGEGNDTIYGFSSNDTLNITSGTVKKVTKGGDNNKDLVITVDKQTITLKDAATDDIHLQYGTYGTVVTNSDTALTKGWIVQDGVATYGTAGKPIVQITGVASDATAASFAANSSGSTVTVMGSALGDETLKVTKGSTKLVLATKGSDTVKAAKTTTKGKWTVTSTTALYYAATTTDGYTLSSDKKSVTHTDASTHGGELTAIITGVAKNTSANNFSINESTGVITLKKAALPTGSSATNIQLINPVEDVTNKLALDSKVTQYKVTDPGWSVSGTTATYKTGSKTAGFVLADDGLSVSYNTDAEKAATGATITGLKKGVKAYSLFANTKNNTITLTKDMIGTSNISMTTTADYSDWKLTLDSGIAEPTYSKESYWTAKGTQYTFVTPKVATAGYSLNGNTVTYSKAKSGGSNSVVLKGLKEGLEYTAKGEVTADIKGTLQGVDYDTRANNVVIGASAVDTDNAINIQIAGTVTKGTIFTLSEGVAPGDEELTNKLTNTTSAAIVMEGNSSNNILAGGAGAETIYGGAGADSINGGKGADVLYSGTGSAKTLLGGAGNDTLFGQNTSGEIVFDDDGKFDSATVILDGGDDNDLISLAGGAAYVTGGKGKDTIYGGSGDDLLYGDNGTGNLKGDGANIIYGGAGNDTIYGGVGADKLYGDKGNDYIEGGAGNDVAEGGLGDDTLIGGDGNDKLSGDDGNDSLIGGKGNDTLYGGAGSDYLDGGDGNDKLYSGSGSAKTLLGGAGNDTLYAENTSSRISTVENEDEEEVEVSSVILDGGAGNDVLYASTVGGGGGSLSGGAGNDTLYGGVGDVTLNGDAGNDTFVYSTSYEDNVISDYTTYNSSKKTGDTIKLTDYSAKSATITKDADKEEVYIKLGESGPVLTVKVSGEFEDATIYVAGVVGKKTDSVSKKVSAITAVESGLFAEDNFVTADSLSDIVETSSVGEFDLNADSDKLQAENLITYAEK